MNPRRRRRLRQQRADTICGEPRDVRRAVLAYHAARVLTESISAPQREAAKKFLDAYRLPRAR